ncbi:MAG: isopentenyl phosphate kinase family protein [Candidatus Freyarchaeota archaeon]|nr:isopentenyl phosphate kinase family protein [Candidatus Jordarchaeia archaeon]
MTNKNKPFSIRRKVIKRISEEVATAIRSGCPPLVIVHGGGSFGHPLAKKYGIHHGFREETQLIGFAETVQAMRRLSGVIAENLHTSGVPALPLQPSAITVQKNGRIAVMFSEVIEKALAMGFTPVLWGDAVLDEEKRFTILSGDQIVSHLSAVLSPLRVVFGTDVDGICPTDPKRTKTRPFEELKRSELEMMTTRPSESGGVDVTGGMMGKLNEIISITSRGIEVVVTNATKAGNILRALLGGKVGTLVKP